MALGVTMWAVLGLAWALESLPADSPLLAKEGESVLIEGKTRSSIREEEAKITEYKWGELLNHLQVPTAFDSRNQWKGCIHAIQDFGEDCPDCSWAVSAADVLSDRLCIQKSQQAILSPQFIIDCQTDANGSDGGTAAQAWMWLMGSGTPLATCVPFTGESDYCPNLCANSTPMSKFIAVNAYTYTGIQAMQAAIMQGGPIQACFQLYTDFLDYNSGMYIQSYGNLERTECVKLIGWGSLNGSSYWIGAGSYGTGWGIGGYFWFKMGQQQLQMETNAAAGFPA